MEEMEEYIAKIVTMKNMVIAVVDPNLEAKMSFFQHKLGTPNAQVVEARFSMPKNFSPNLAPTMSIVSNVTFVKNL